MRRSSWILCLVAAMQLVGCAGMSRGKHTSDASVTRHVERRLMMDPDASAIDVDVDTIGGIVTLRGEVSNEIERTAAEDVTRYTKGVRGVRNLLVVKDRDLGDATEEGLSDAWIRTKLGSRLLADPDIHRFPIDVDVDDGVVTLSGSVPTERERTVAEDVARRTTGVRRVINEITISSEHSPAPVVESSEGREPSP